MQRREGVGQQARARRGGEEQQEGRGERRAAATDRGGRRRRRRRGRGGGGGGGEHGRGARATARTARVVVAAENRKLMFDLIPQCPLLPLHL